MRETQLTADVFEEVPTKDSRYKAYGTGFTIKRPKDKRGDSVNHIVVGARFDMLAEVMDKHVDNARAETDADLREAEILHPVPDAV